MSSPHLPALSDKNPRRKLTAAHYKFAFWYANEDRPPKELQAKVLSAFLNEGRDKALPAITATYDQVRTLKGRSDFQEDVTTCREGGIQAARALVVSDLPLYAELHRWAALKAKEKEDYRAVPLLTVPMLKAALPEQTINQRMNIVIALSPTRATLLDDVPPEVLEAEIIPPDSETPS